MFYYIKGIVTEKFADKAVVDVNGVGFEILCSSRTLDAIATGKEALLYTYLHLSEGIMALYGFISCEERDMFKNLIAVSRIGPKIGIAVLSKMTPSDVGAAVLTESVDAFKMVPGLGSKNAQRIIMELREKVLNADIRTETATEEPSGSKVSVMSDAVAALVSLGYDGLSASRAVNAVKDYESLEDLIKKSLQHMTK